MYLSEIVRFLQFSAKHYRAVSISVDLKDIYVIFTELCNKLRNTANIEQLLDVEGQKSNLGFRRTDNEY